MTAHRTHSGYTLVEMLITLVLLAALLTIMLPAYRAHILRSYRVVAAHELMQLMARQDIFFQQHKRYAQDFTDLGLSTHPYAIDGSGAELVVDSGRRTYRIELNSVGNGYQLVARPQLAQAADTQCGELRLTDYGLRSVSGPSAPSSCW